MKGLITKEMVIEVIKGMSVETQEDLWLKDFIIKRITGMQELSPYYEFSKRYDEYDSEFEIFDKLILSLDYDNAEYLSSSTYINIIKESELIISFQDETKKQLERELKNAEAKVKELKEKLGVK